MVRLSAGAEVALGRLVAAGVVGLGVFPEQLAKKIMNRMNIAVKRFDVIHKLYHSTFQSKTFPHKVSFLDYNVAINYPAGDFLDANFGDHPGVQ